MTIEMSIENVLTLIIKNIENKNYFNAITIAEDIIEQIKEKNKESKQEKTPKDDKDTTG